MPLEAGYRLGPYEVLGHLGAGGMGEVYRARDTRLSREVAIKVLPADIVNDADRRARFEREAQAISALNHPNIVTLHEVGTSDAGPYLVLEKIEGHSLRDLLTAEPLSLRRLLSIAAQVADGLAKAHSAGIVHRDLKPDNVMITGDGFAKILDFGLARLVWPELHAGVDDDTTLVRDTASGLILGTLGYLSPEQAAGKPADFRADQFSLGALLYEMAARERPFRRATMAESLAATIREEAESLRLKRADLPQPLCWIVDRCLAKDPNDRYASTRDLARDLADVRDRLSDFTRQPQAENAASASPVSEWRRRIAIVGAVAVTLLAGYALGLISAPGAVTPTFRPLTFQRGIITGANFSPDGQTIYYSAAYGADPSRVFVTRPDQGSASELVNLSQSAILLSVSRKGELAVLLTNDRNTANSVGTLATVPALGGSPREILANVSDASWAPNGEDVAVQRLDGSIEFPIGHRLAEGQFPRVSPSGNRIAWLEEQGIVIADVDGRPLVRDALWGFGLAWRPDGRELWFTGDAEGSGAERHLFGLSSNGTRRLLVRVPGALTLFDVAADGRSALVTHGAGRWGIVARRGAGPEKALDLFGRTQLVGLSADGRWVLAYEPHQAGRGTYLRSTDGAQNIFFGRDPAIALSPDGQWVLVQKEKEPARLALLPTSAATGSPRDVIGPKGLVSQNLAAWSADRRRLFVTFSGPNGAAPKPRLFMREDEGDWRPVTPEGLASQFVVSPDGRQVLMNDATGTLTRFPVDGGPAQPVTGEHGVPVAWSTDGRWLFLRVRRSVPARLYRREVASGRIEPWRDIAPDDLSGVNAIGDPVLLANDGELVVYSYSRIANVLYLVQGIR